jgi:FAD/FMN-containing dehydrogenase
MLSAFEIKNIFSSIIPTERILSDEQSLLTYGKDWLTDFKPQAALVLLPESALEVQNIIKLANQNKIAIVPSGGRTGLSGGATACNGEAVLSLERMNKILAVNRAERTLTCQAGVVTERVQLRAAEEGLYFPIDFASKGSSQIGGNIATNAGGIRVIRYGMLREWVIGLTVVTGSGELLQLNGSLIKNQSGYDLRQLMIGSEGTLGVIVEAIIGLTSPPQDSMRFLCALPSAQAALGLLEKTRDSFAMVNVFEYFDSTSLQKVTLHHKLPQPFPQSFVGYALVEVEGDSQSLATQVEELLSKAAEAGDVDDAIIGLSTKQAQDLLRYRELISETLSAMHTIHKNDISVPPSAIPAFLDAFALKLKETYPDFEAAIFGHIGDGNLHINILKPQSLTDSNFFACCHEADSLLFKIVKDFSGSISAEHGVGLLKRDFLHFCRTDAEIAIMKGIKAVFDPAGILNPGKIFS